MRSQNIYAQSPPSEVSVSGAAAERILTLISTRISQRMYQPKAARLLGCCPVVTSCTYLGAFREHTSFGAARADAIDDSLNEPLRLAILPPNVPLASKGLYCVCKREIIKTRITLSTKPLLVWCGSVGACSADGFRPRVN